MNTVTDKNNALTIATVKCKTVYCNCTQTVIVVTGKDKYFTCIKCKGSSYLIIELHKEAGKRRNIPNHKPNEQQS